MQGMVWNGTKISLSKMENAKMEWNGMEDFKYEMEDNHLYQFHTRFCVWYSVSPQNGIAVNLFSKTKNSPLYWDWDENLLRT